MLSPQSSITSSVPAGIEHWLIHICASKQDSGIIVKTKNPENINKPASAINATTFKTTYPIRKTYTKIVDDTTKKGYRSDLRAEAVARASAIKFSQRAKKDAPARKVRGAKKAEKNQEQ